MVEWVGSIGSWRRREELRNDGVGEKGMEKRKKLILI